VELGQQQLQVESFVVAVVVLVMLVAQALVEQVAEAQHNLVDLLDLTLLLIQAAVVVVTHQVVVVMLVETVEAVLSFSSIQILEQLLLVLD
jgi:hypothetical protein